MRTTLIERAREGGEAAFTQFVEVVWLRRLIASARCEELRRHRRWSASVRMLPIDGPADGDSYVTVDERATLERSFRQFSPEHRAAVVLRRHAGMPLALIAESAGVPVGFVKSRLHDVNRILRCIPASDRVEQRERRPA